MRVLFALRRKSTGGVLPPFWRCNPADRLSRGFGAHTTAKEVPRKNFSGVGLPPLACARSLLFDEAEMENFQPAKRVYLGQGALQLTMGLALPLKKNWYGASGEANMWDMQKRASTSFKMRCWKHSSFPSFFYFFFFFYGVMAWAAAFHPPHGEKSSW